MKKPRKEPNKITFSFYKDKNGEVVTEFSEDDDHDISISDLATALMFLTEYYEYQFECSVRE